MNAIDVRIATIGARLRVLPSPAERIAALADRGKRLPALHDHERIDSNLVAGCVSRVWLVGGNVEGRAWFRADADSVMVKGLVTLAWEIANQQSVTDLAGASDGPVFIAALGLDGQLSPTRLHGVGQVWRRMRELASRPVAAPGLKG